MKKHYLIILAKNHKTYIDPNSIVLFKVHRDRYWARPTLEFSLYIDGFTQSIECYADANAEDRLVSWLLDDQYRDLSRTNIEMLEWDLNEELEVKWLLENKREPFAARSIDDRLVGRVDVATKDDR
jgi:hypothetical protein